MVKRKTKNSSKDALSLQEETNQVSTESDTERDPNMNSFEGLSEDDHSSPDGLYPLMEQLIEQTAKSDENMKENFGAMAQGFKVMEDALVKMIEVQNLNFKMLNTNISESNDRNSGNHCNEDGKNPKVAKSVQEDTSKDQQEEFNRAKWNTSRKWTYYSPSDRKMTACNKGPSQEDTDNKSHSNEERSSQQKDFDRKSNQKGHDQGIPDKQYQRYSNHNNDRNTHGHYPNLGDNSGCQQPSSHQDSDGKQKYSQPSSPFQVNQFSLATQEKIRFSDIISHVKEVSLEDDSARAMKRFYSKLMLAIQVGFQYNMSFIPAFEDLTNSTDFVDIFFQGIRGSTTFDVVR